MPLEKIETTKDRIQALWKVDEDEIVLSALLNPYEQLPESITNTQKRLESLAGRVLVKVALKEWGLPFQGITKDEFGKPHLTGCDYHVSLSHSFPYVTALIDKYKIVGIDLEQPKPKLLRIAPRILDSIELQDAGDNLTKHCVYWCAKEALIKYYGKKDLFFIKNLKITPFNLSKEGNISGRIIVNDREVTIPLRYIVKENFVVVFSQ